MHDVERKLHIMSYVTAIDLDDASVGLQIPSHFVLALALRTHQTRDSEADGMFQRS